MNKKIIPAHLETSFKMIRYSFPDGISEEEYFILISILYNHFSDRNLAELLVLLTGKETEICLNDVYKINNTKDYDYKEALLIIEKLKKNGFDEWLNEE